MYVLLTFLLIITSPMTIVSTYYFLINHQSKQYDIVNRLKVTDANKITLIITVIIKRNSYKELYILLF